MEVPPNNHIRKTNVPTPNVPYVSNSALRTRDRSSAPDTHEGYVQTFLPNGLVSVRSLPAFRFLPRRIHTLSRSLALLPRRSTCIVVWQRSLDPEINSSRLPAATGRWIASFWKFQNRRYNEWFFMWEVSLSFQCWFVLLANLLCLSVCLSVCQ
jgi:hypothetical protein